MAGCAQGLDPGRGAHVPSGRGHRRPAGQNHPTGDRVPWRTSRQGDHGHEGYHGGSGLGAGTQGVPLAPGHATERHQATPPFGGPSGYSSAGERAPACPAVGRSPPRVPGPAATRKGLGTHHRVDGRAPDRRLLPMGPNVAGPPRHRHRGAAAVSVDSHSPSGRGKVQVPSRVRGAQVPRAPEQGAPLLLP